MTVTCARLTCLLLVVAAGGAQAQTLPSEPIALANGRVTISGDVSAGFGSEDLGFFNYTDYEHSALRMLRLDVSTAIKAGPHFTILGEIRSENLGTVRPYALYLRIKPWTLRDFDIQVGRVPPTFGAFARRTYANDNPLIGYPLAYQYLTTLRPDSIPASAEELLMMIVCLIVVMSCELVSPSPIVHRRESPLFYATIEIYGRLLTN